MQSIQRLFIAFPLTLGAAAPVCAVDMSAYVEAGAEYDSNLNVEALETASGKSDQALLIGTGVEASGQPADHLTLTGTYDFTSRNYKTYSDFDQDLHLASADLSYDIASVTLGASHHFSYATLDSDPFLKYGRTSAYLGKLIGDDVYLLASIVDKRKSFEEDDERDARARGLSLESFFFFNDSQTLFVLGFEGDEEDANSDAYDYAMLAARLRLKHHFRISGQKNTLRFGWRYESREYDEPVSTEESPGFPLPGPGSVSSETRSDRISIADVSWTIGLTRLLSAEARVETTDASSTLDSADYDKTVASVTLRAEF
ncbi:hypothetical protein KFJ24_14990 [Marinobacter sediminum]|uniref:hypothetical protein n=1 Tax=Marinobacter sediminum TaxID=256323 RepID=UPI00202E78FF|nr:hypothetical protein [Marinobacter sediminum]MCM0613790.1 hypothetical protein [Marinobacter sediminum]